MKRKIVARNIDLKRFSGEDMMRFARYVTGMNRHSSLLKLTSWLDGPPESGRSLTLWKNKSGKYL